MRLPHVRFTVRRMMVMVAALALILGVASELRRASDRAKAYRQMAQEHHRAEEFYSKAIMALRPDPASPSYTVTPEQWRVHGEHSALRQQYSNRFTYHARLGRKYDSLSEHPWSHASPDPEPPRVSKLPYIQRESSLSRAIQNAMPEL